MKFKEYYKVKTFIKKEGYPPSTIGIIVSFYANSDFCEVELWDRDEDLVDVVTYEAKELELI